MTSGQVRTPRWQTRTVRLKRRLARWVVLALVAIFTRTRIQGQNKLDELDGKVIVASNHLGRLDAFYGILLIKRTNLIMVVAEKYRDHPVFRVMVEQLDLLWLERFGADLGTLKEVLRRLDKGGILLIAPEGTRSTTEALLEGKPGVAYLASKSGAPVVPAVVFGTEDRVVKAAFRRRRRPKVNVIVGEPFMIPPLPKTGRDVFLRQQTDEIMAQIAVLLPEKYRGVYREHPRVGELLSYEVSN